MKKFTIPAVLALAFAAALPAQAIEVVNNQSAAVAPRLPDLAAAPRTVALTSVQSSELPEPEVFAMMLLGLVLIGYRASRDSNEKFK